MSEVHWVRDEEAMQKLAADIAAKEAARSEDCRTPPALHSSGARNLCSDREPGRVLPNYQGTLGECRLWAEEKGAEWNLPIVEAPGKNPDLQSRTFETPAIYIVTVEFDEFESRGGQRRVFRY